MKFGLNLLTVQAACLPIKHREIQTILKHNLILQHQSRRDKKKSSRNKVNISHKQNTIKTCQASIRRKKQCLNKLMLRNQNRKKMRYCLPLRNCDVHFGCQCFLFLQSAVFFFLSFTKPKNIIASDWSIFIF